ncbi:sialate O-acetylesterase [Cohnella phaseoli]|uniref:Carbohydrate esterase-like sialic acid-specific acetylesterase n=1 Tax=Cohnella phaseoli TaxID=456490 RepID=A0A3D9I265_9BACL|nr:sialate O-acetylesterase [Cohnella phaseoli]RED55882.1 carbohydrate esterase-like sialic acid-specific acetylesterase [Cohnella phaseoli]
MTTRTFGATITEGPQHWAIVQRQRESGTIALAGEWSTRDGSRPDQPTVHARVVHEDGRGAVVPWIRCATGEDGTWSVRLEVPEGGLYRIETCLRLNDLQPMELAARGDMIHHIGIGDIWVIAGQSNATGYGRGAVSDSPETGVHLLRHNGRWDLATHPFNESTDTVQPLNGEPVNPGHSPYLAFAKELKKATGIPIGLLQTALGGSPLSRWNPNEDGDLYRNMMEVVGAAGGEIKGVLWYQGCSDCDSENAPSYYRRFALMVERWRQDTGDDKLPFLSVQLNRNAAYAEGIEGDRCWGLVREAQRRAAERIAGVEIVPSLDSPLSDIIHNGPAGNLMIGWRLANTALGAVYGKAIPHRAPNLALAVRGEAEQTVLLQFDDIHGQLFAVGPGERIFSIEDEKGFHVVDRWQVREGSRIELILSRPLEGKAFVHGAFEANPSAFPLLDTGTQLPMLSFYGVEIE